MKELLQAIEDNPGLPVRYVIAGKSEMRNWTSDAVEIEVGTYWVWEEQAYTDKKELIEDLTQEIEECGDDLPDPNLFKDAKTNYFRVLRERVEEKFNSLFTEKAIVVTISKGK